MPAKSTVRPPNFDRIPNPERPTNPFTETAAPDWVERAKRNEPNLNRSTSSSSVSLVSIAPSKLGPRKLPPPYNPADLPLLPQRLPAPLEPTKQGLVVPPPMVSRQNAPEIPIPSHPSTGKLQKPAPPVPKKPAVLSLRDNQPPLLDQDASFQRSSMTGAPMSTKYATPSMMFPPPPRRVGTTPISPTNNMSVLSLGFRDDTNVPSPALPPRKRASGNPRGRSGLLDDDDEGGMSSIPAWKPLRPT